jgi:hypothetical protein
MGTLLRRLYWLLNRRKMERALSEEMQEHRERMGGRNAQFGSSLRLMEEARDAWGWRWLEDFLQDLRYAARQMAQAKSFTAAAISVLALGISVTIGCFGVFSQALRPLPVRDPDSLVSFLRAGRGRIGSQVPFPALAF